MRRTLEFWFDLSTTFHLAVVAVLVFIGGTREHILALWGLIFTFYQIFTRPDVRANFGEFLSMCRGSDLGSNRRMSNNRRSKYNRIFALQARTSLSLTYGHSP